MTITINPKSVLKVDLTKEEIETIIDSLEYQPQTLYRFLNCGVLVKKLKTVLLENGLIWLFIPNFGKPWESWKGIEETWTWRIRRKIGWGDEKVTCPVCEQCSNCMCLCGFCPACIERYTHEGCAKIVKEKKCSNKK